MHVDNDVLGFLLSSRLQDECAPKDKYVLTKSESQILMQSLGEKKADVFSKVSVSHHNDYMRKQHIIYCDSEITSQFQDVCTKIRREYEIKKYVILEKLLMNFLENPLEIVRNIQEKPLHTGSPPIFVGTYCQTGIIYKFQDVCKEIRRDYKIKQYLIVEELLMNFLENPLETVKNIQEEPLTNYNFFRKFKGIINSSRKTVTLYYDSGIVSQFQDVCKEIRREYKIKQYVILEELLMNFLKNPLETVRNIQEKPLRNGSPPIFVGTYCQTGIVSEFQDLCTKIRRDYKIKQYDILEELLTNFLENPLETIRNIQKKSLSAQKVR